MTDKVAKSLEDLTLEELKAQISIYTNYYQKRRKQEDPEFAERVKEQGRQKYYRRKAKELEKNPEPKNRNRKYDHSSILLIDVVQK